MLTFLKHKFTRKEKTLAKWGFSHVVGAMVAGVLLAGGLLLWQFSSDHSRVQVMKQAAGQAAEQAVPIPPNTGKVGGPFILTGPNGAPVSDKDFASKYLLIYFGYTSCPDMCPTGLQSMSGALDMLKQQADKVQPLFITVDPARDTPARLRDYDATFNPRIIGLTGTAEQIASVAKEYQVYYEKEDGDQDYEVDHSTLIYLMDPAGNLVTTFDEEVAPKEIVAALHKAWRGDAGAVQ